MFWKLGIGSSLCGAEDKPEALIEWGMADLA